MQAALPRAAPPVAVGRGEAAGPLQSVGAVRRRRRRPRQVAEPRLGARPAPQHLLVPADAAQGLDARFGGAERGRRVPERGGGGDGRLHAREPAELCAGREAERGRRRQQQAARR